MSLFHRLSAVVLSLALLAGNATVCAGWAGTAAERMACCAEGYDCPMREGESHHTGADHGLTQAEADACCASSERETSTPSTPTFVTALSFAILGPGTLQPQSVPALVLSDVWRTVSPVPTTPIPKHVLLSVFLV